MGTNRGATLESFLCKVACVGAPVVACTATASNLGALAAWLGAGLYETAECPTTVAIHLALAPPMPRRMMAPTEEVATRIWAEGGARVDERRLAVTAPADYDVGDAVVDKLCLDDPPGPVMLFVASRADARAAAVRLAERRWRESGGAQDQEKAACRAALAERLRSASPPDAAHAADLRACCRHGVLFHHAGLAAAEREMVEAAFARKDCDVLCCTTTLAVGVHLPVARVVVKGGGQRRTGAELRQMIGRAGRAGFGTKRAPDAWIVCAGGNGERGAGGAEKLLGAAAPPILSRLRNDDDGLRRHVLEAVSGGLIARREVMAAFDGALDAGPPLRWLAARGFLRPGGANWKDPPGEAPSVLLDDTWEPTPLGAATVGAGLGPADALEVAAALRCRHGVDYGGVAPEYALLHRLYLTAPLQQNVLGGQAHWAAFGDALKAAGKGAREVFKLCGGCEEHVARRARGLAATAESEAKNVPGTPDRVCRRFALALLLHDRIGLGPGHHQGPVPQEDGTVGAGLGPADALEVAAALRCRHGVDYGGVAPEYALLHRLYLTAPLQQNVLGGQAHWAAFGDALKAAGKGAREVFKLCGGCEEHVARRARGLAATAESEAKNVPGTPDRVCRRFALALLLHDRIGLGPGHHQGPVPQEDGTWGRNQTSSGTPSFAAAFAARYREHAGPDVSLTKCEGGDVDNYSRDAATLARRLEYFCRKLAWLEAARACKSARGLLARGAPDELVRLMRASPGNITRARARALHDVGFESAADLAEADATDISAALYDAAAFDPSAAFADAAAARLAACIIADATKTAAREAALPVDDSGGGDDDDDESAARDSDEDSAPDPDLPEASDSDSMDGL